MSLALNEWISGALSRSDSARSSPAAPWHPVPHMITTLPAWSIRRASAVMSASFAASSGRGFKVATLETPFRLRRDDILRQRQVGDARASVGGGDRLMNDTRRLRRRSDGFGVERDVSEQKIGLSRLDVVGAVQLARHVARQRQDGRVVAVRLIEPGDQMVTAGAGGAGTDREATGQLGLAGRSECRSFLVADTDPLDLAAPDGVGKRVERVADQAEYLLDPDLLKHADQNVRNCLCHLSLLTGVITHAPCASKGIGRRLANTLLEWPDPTLTAINAHAFVASRA